MNRHEVQCQKCRAEVIVVTARDAADRDEQLRRNGWDPRARHCPACKRRGR